MKTPEHSQTFVCYDIHSFFETYPELVNCPLCGAPLHKRDTPHSVKGLQFRRHSMIPGVKTCLFTCSQCGWWAVRERLTEFEVLGWEEDYLVTMLLPDKPDPDETAANPANHVAEPWKTILADQKFWEHPCELPLAVALKLFGTQEVEQRKRKKALRQPET